jgi:TPR repeat protein
MLKLQQLNEPTAIYNLALMYADGVVVAHDQFKAYRISSSCR